MSQAVHLPNSTHRTSWSTISEGSTCSNEQTCTDTTSDGNHLEMTLPVTLQQA